MRILPIVKFFVRRHYKGILLWTALSFVTTMVALMFMYTNTATIVDVSGGQVAVQEVTSAYNDLSSVTASYDLTIMIVLLALLTIRKNRELLTTLSVTRYEQIIAGFVYMAVMSLGLTILGEFVMPLLTRIIMAAFGFQIRGGWSAMMILTGDNPDLIKEMYNGFIFMVALGSVYTLLGYFMLRWWKIVLIAMAACAAGFIVVMTQYSESKFIMYVIEHGEEIIAYIRDVVLPLIDRVLDNSNTLLYTLRYLGFSVLCTALSYPIMRRMTVR